jgi:hypothetical protein
MKRFILGSLLSFALCSALSAYAAPFTLNQDELAILEESELDQAPTENICDGLKPKETSSGVSFNASPCFGVPRKISPNPTTRAAAAYACGRHAGLWEAYCKCQSKKLQYEPSFIGNVYLVNCKRDPNSKVDCGTFSCE